MIKAVLNIKGQTVYQDQAAGRSYRRVLGAVAWPAPPEPGYLVALAEAWSMSPELQKRPLYVLGERPAATMREVLQGMLELRRSCRAAGWLADLGRRQEVSLWRHESERLPVEARPAMYAAPYSREASAARVYWLLINELVQPQRKVLWFGEGSRLPGYFLGLAPDRLELPAAKLPPLAALGYAAAEMVLTAPMPGAAEKRAENYDWPAWRQG